MGSRSGGAAHRHPEPDLPAARAGSAGLSRRGAPERLAGLTDSHAHLQHEAFGADAGEVIGRAIAAGMETIVVPGWDLPSSVAALDLATRYAPTIRAGVGIHPHDAGDADEAAWAELEVLSADPRCAAIGEIGLDYHRNISPPDRQRDAFERQLQLAATRGLPVLVHAREAHGDVSDALLRWRGRQGAVRGALHAFSGDAEMALRLAAGGFLISFALPVAFRSARGPRDAAPRLDEASLLLETDSPYLGPDAVKRNEPTTALKVAAELATLRSTTPDVIVAAASANLRRLLEVA